MQHGTFNKYDQTLILGAEREGLKQPSLQTKCCVPRQMARFVSGQMAQIKLRLGNACHGTLLPKGYRSVVTSLQQSNTG